MNGIYKVPFYRMLKVLDVFQEEAGLARHTDALNAVLSLNRGMVMEAERGVTYATSMGDQACRISLSELYSAHIQKARSVSRDIYLPLKGVDDVHLEAIRKFVRDNRIDYGSSADILTAATSLASCMYRHFGSGKSGEMHIPTIPGGLLPVASKHNLHFKIN